MVVPEVDVVVSGLIVVVPVTVVVSLVIVSVEVPELEAVTPES